MRYGCKLYKLWKKLIDLEMSRTELRLKADLSTRQLAKLGKNENVTTAVLVKVCKAARLYIINTGRKHNGRLLKAFTDFTE